MKRVSLKQTTFPAIVVAAMVWCGSANAGTLLVSNIFSSGGVSAFDSSTGASQGAFSPGLPPYSQSSGLVVKSNGNVLVANYAGYPDSSVYQYDPYGTPLGILATSPGIILGMGLSADGTLYILNQTSNGNEYIDKYNSTTGASLGNLVGGGAWFGLNVASNGNIITDTYGQLQVYNPSGTLLNSFSGMYLASHVTSDAAGDIFTSSFFNNQDAIYKCAGCASGSGSNVQLATNSSGFGGMTIGPDGSLYVAITVSSSLAGIEKYNAVTGADLGLFASASVNSLAPFELAFTGNTFSSAAPEPSTMMLSGSVGFLLLALSRRAAGRQNC